MPPKKKVEEEKKVRLGKPSNTLKMGIVGLPNVGKSTTFNLLCRQQVAEAANYPFCTIDPNLAQVTVPDDRFDRLCEIYKPKSKVKAILRVLDIAGLVPGASKGEGLGNAFLSHIRECDAIFQVVRAFDDPEVTHTENEVNPIRDMEIIRDELLLKDIEFIEKRLKELQLKVDKNGKDNDSQIELAHFKKFMDCVNDKKWLIQGEWNTKDIECLNLYNFLTAKQVVYLVNLSEADYLRKKNKWLPKIAQWIKENLQGQCIPYSAEHEGNLFQAELAEKEKRGPQNHDEIKAAETSMIPKIVKCGYKVLDLMYFFTAGPDEVRAWTLRKGKLAPEAAGVIHTDFEKGFIAVEVMQYEDFVRCGSESAVKAEGKYLSKGRDYEITDGEICFFRFNTTKGGKK